MKLFIYLLFIYLTVYTVYYLSLVYSGLKSKRRKNRDLEQRRNNLCVVVYSHNNKATIENLVKQLKNQTYPKNNYTIQVILDNCTDESEILFQGDLDVTVMNIKNVDTIGKEQAFSILTEKYLPIKDLDAYVFLDAKYYVNQDFLEKINEVIIPCVCHLDVCKIDLRSLRVISVANLKTDYKRKARLLEPYISIVTEKFASYISSKGTMRTPESLLTHKFICQDIE